MDIGRINGVSVNNNGYKNKQDPLIKQFTGNLRLEGASQVLQPWEMWYPQKPYFAVNDGIDSNPRRQAYERQHTDHLHVGF